MLENCNVIQNENELINVWGQAPIQKPEPCFVETGNLIAQSVGLHRLENGKLVYVRILWARAIPTLTGDPRSR